MRRTARSAAIFGLTAMLAAATAGAQGTMPRVSQRASVTQRIGITDVTVDYHRPGVKGRQVWGGLVPYDQPWRMGANDRTRITFSSAVRVGEQKLDAGSYGLVAIPGEETWTIAFSKVAESWGTFSYDPANDAVRLTVTPRAAPHTEWMRFDFENLGPSSADVVLSWADLAVSFPIAVDTDALVVSRVNSALAGGAEYCSGSEGCAADALPWADLAASASPTFWNWRLKARIHAANQQWAEAVAAGDKALEIAAGMDDPPPANYLDEVAAWIADWKEHG